MLLSSCFQSTLSILAALIVLPTTFMKDSAVPFAWGQRGVTFLWINPLFCANSANFLLLKGGPLSDVSESGTPFETNISFSSLMMLSASVDWFLAMTRISGHLEYKHLTTSIFSPVGTGPKRSAETDSHGPFGSSGMWRGVEAVWGVAAWHGRHDLMYFSISWSKA